jgi:hypothetical protein
MGAYTSKSNASIYIFKKLERRYKNDQRRVTAAKSMAMEKSNEEVHWVRLKDILNNALNSGAFDTDRCEKNPNFRCACRMGEIL